MAALVGVGALIFSGFEFYQTLTQSIRGEVDAKLNRLESTFSERLTERTAALATASGSLGQSYEELRKRILTLERTRDDLLRLERHVRDFETKSNAQQHELRKELEVRTDRRFRADEFAIHDRRYSERLKTLDRRLDKLERRVERLEGRWLGQSGGP